MAQVCCCDAELKIVPCVCLVVLYTKVYYNGAKEKCRVARWFIRIPEIQIWVHFGGRLNGNYLYT
jgi:hypothetical protein